MSILDAIRELNIENSEKVLDEDYNDLDAAEKEIAELKKQLSAIEAKLTGLDSYKIKTYYPSLAKELEDAEEKYNKALEEYNDYLKAEGEYFKELEVEADKDNSYYTDNWRLPNKEDKPEEYSKAIELKQKYQDLAKNLNQVEKELIDKVKMSDEFNKNKEMKADIENALNKKEKERNDRSNEMSEEYKEIIDILVKNVSRDPSFTFDKTEPDASGISVYFKKELDLDEIMEDENLDEDNTGSFEVDPDCYYCDNVCDDLANTARLDELEEDFSEYTLDVYCDNVDSNISVSYNKYWDEIEYDGEAIGFFVIRINKIQSEELNESDEEQDKERYRDEISRIAHNQAIMLPNNWFHIYNVKERDVDEIIRKLKSLAYIKDVRKNKTGKYDFKTFTQVGRIPECYWDITGLIEE